MAKEKNLYFIAIIPPDPVYQEIWAMKKDFEENYKSKAALNSPPHVTLHMPFKITSKKEDILVDLLRKVAQKTHTFQLTLDGFGHFNEKVIYIAITKSDPLTTMYKSIANLMKKEFLVFNSDYKNRGYHPHITVAFRNLNKTNFKIAWPIYNSKKYDRTFEATQLTLLKHNGKKWESFKQFPLQSI